MPNSVSTLPISVIIPIYNHESYIRHCLESISKAAIQPEEIVLVDNASTDGSVAAAEALALPNLLVIRNSSNVGATQARHIAMQKARCAHYCFVDSDDWLSPDALRLGFSELATRSLDACLFTMHKMSADGTSHLFSLEPPKDAISGQKAFELTVGAWRIDSRGVYKRDVYDRAYEHFQFAGHSDDEVLSRLCFLEAGRVGGTSGAYFYRHVNKPPSFEMVLGQATTNLRVLQIAAERLPSGSRPLKDMRNVVVRNLLGMAVRAARRRGAGGRAFAELRRQYACVPVPWDREDARYRLMDKAVAAAALGFRVVGR